VNKEITSAEVVVGDLLDLDSIHRTTVREHVVLYAGVFEALGRTATFQDMPVEPWQDALLERWPVDVVTTFAAMADLHRAGRFDHTAVSM